MKCNGCKYLGKEFEHLRGFQDIKEWRYCSYPLPYNVVQTAVALMGTEHDCKVFEQALNK